MTICATKDCGGEGIWSPIMELRPPKHLGDAVLPMVMGMRLCDKCKEKTIVADLLNKSAVLDVMQAMGLATPDFSRTTLAFAKDDDELVQTLLKVQKAKDSHRN